MKFIVHSRGDLIVGQERFKNRKLWRIVSCIIVTDQLKFHCILWIIRKEKLLKIQARNMYICGRCDLTIKLRSLSIAKPGISYYQSVRTIGIVEARDDN